MSTLSDDDELLAAELAFGLLDPADRPAADRRLADDPAFAAAHRRWTEHAAALLTGPGESPRREIWAAIEMRLGANDNALTVARGTLRLWQGATALATAAALVLAVTWQGRPAPTPLAVPTAPEARAPLVAILTQPDGKAVMTVSYDATGRRLLTAPAGLAIKDRAAELWVIPADGKPRSLGVVPSVAPGWVPAREAAALVAGVTLAITVEQPGGSPSGQPTGAPILVGKLIAA